MESAVFQVVNHTPLYRRTAADGILLVIRLGIPFPHRGATGTPPAVRQPLHDALYPDFGGSAVFIEVSMPYCQLHLHFHYSHQL